MCGREPNRNRAVTPQGTHERKRWTEKKKRLRETQTSSTDKHVAQGGKVNRQTATHLGRIRKVTTCHRRQKSHSPAEEGPTKPSFVLAKADREEFHGL